MPPNFQELGEMLGVSTTPRFPPAGGGAELFYAPVESIFGGSAARMVSLGWSVFPQSRVDRRPGKVKEMPIAWAAEHDLRNRRPDAKTLETWGQFCATLNVACVFGPASGNTWALDIDVTDNSIAWKIERIADRILGPTPLMREGSRPKIAYIYRHTVEDPIRTAVRALAVEGGHAIEIQGSGKLLTFHGAHHKTGRYFKWLDLNPLSSGPDVAPIVSSAQVAAFWAEIETRWGFERKVSSAAGRDFVYSGSKDTAGYQIPRPDVRGGKRREGRYHLLGDICLAAVINNAERIHAAVAAGDAAVAECKATLCTVAMDSFCGAAEVGGAWTLARAESTVRKDVGNTVNRALRGELRKFPAAGPVPATAKAEPAGPPPPSGTALKGASVTRKSTHPRAFSPARPAMRASG